MIEAMRCPVCGSVPAEPVAGDPMARCANCGATLAPASADWNPYSAPTSPLKDQVDEFAAPMTVPRTVFGKFGMAFWLLGSNLPLIFPIVLTVWLPVNLAIQTLEIEAPPGQEGMWSFRLNSLAEAVFGPIVLGALIFALGKRVRGERVTYFQAMRVGLGNWGRLFAANFFANLYVLLGLLAFIIPGIMLQVRYALLDPVVVLERSTDPRGRSTRLTTGMRWSIFWSYCLFLGFYLSLSFGVAFLVEVLELPGQPWVGVVIECVLDMVGTLGPIVIFLFYCEARQVEEANAAAEPRDDGPDASRLPDFLRRSSEPVEPRYP